MDEVGDDDMGVELRLGRPGGPVAEPGGDEPVTGHPGQAAPPAAADRGVVLEDTQSGVDGGVVGVADLVRGLGVGQREEQGHRLGGGEGGIEAGDLRV